MLKILSLILLLSPLVFQYIYGTKTLYKTTSMSLGKVSLISLISQIVFSAATFWYATYSFSKYFDEHPNQTRCGTPLAGLLVTLVFLIVVLIAFIIVQFLVKIWKERKLKSYEE